MSRRRYTRHNQYTWRQFLYTQDPNLSFENIFYISSIQNYAEKSLIEYYEICEDGFVVKKSKYKMRAFDKFYNKYNIKTELDIPYSQVKRSVNKTSKNESKKELADDVYITHK